MILDKFQMNSSNVTIAGYIEPDNVSISAKLDLNMTRKVASKILEVRRDVETKRRQWSHLLSLQVTMKKPERAMRIEMRIKNYLVYSEAMF